MLYIAIDPGKTGSVTAYNEKKGTLKVFKCPGTESDMAAELRKLRKKHKKIQVFIEKVHGRSNFNNKKDKGAGAVQNFNFGRNFGAWLGILSALQIPYKEIAPQTWMKRFGGLPTGDVKKRKDEIHRRCQAMFPNVTIYKYAADSVAILSTQVVIEL